MTAEWLDGRDLGLGCLCGSNTFSRVVVHRRPDTPIVTEFVACIECNAMYWLPNRNSGVREPFDYDRAYAHMPKRKPGKKS